MPLHKRQHLGIEQSADVLEEPSHNRRAMVNLGRYPVYSGRVTVSGWNVDWTRIRRRYERYGILFGWQTSAAKR